jgi:NADP-dependent 3-hydroxy acid dehydrogenase YdfG
MSTPIPSITKVWRSAPYPKIAPTRPELSSAGKTIVITGGGTGIGGSITHAFALAGSTQIAILGRRKDKLQERAASLREEFLDKDLEILTFSVDVTEQTEVNTAFEAIINAFGGIDVLIHSAAAMSPFSFAANADIDSWYATFDTNVKGALNVTQAFLRHARPGSFFA